MTPALDPPFLELEYYVGLAELETIVHRLVDGPQPGLVPSKFVIPNAIGLSSKLEELEVKGGVVILRTEGEAFCGPFRNDRTRFSPARPPNPNRLNCRSDHILHAARSTADHLFAAL
jgi:hypothetical protein